MRVDGGNRMHWQLGYSVGYDNQREHMTSGCLRDGCLFSEAWAGLAVVVHCNDAFDAQPRFVMTSVHPTPRVEVIAHCSKTISLQGFRVPASARIPDLGDASCFRKNNSNRWRCPSARSYSPILEHKTPCRTTVRAWDTNDQKRGE